MKINSKVLIIAGSDSSGGAGIQADIKTVTSLGSYAMTAITAVTSQNTTGVKTDPVMVAKGGSRLIDNKSIKILKKKLLKKVTLITPNIPEAEILTHTKINSKEDMIYAANILLKFGAKNVLIKGGHLKTNVMYDIFVNKKEISIFKNKKIKTRNTHGTGCTLSSAIATYYSCGKTLKKSCEMATNYVNHAIGSGPNFGKGHGPINHLNTIIIKKKFR